jgi:tetratricopeptide (TPR) repeat protein
MIGVPGSAHNDYLQILATTGVVGAGLLAAAVGWGIWRGIRRYRRAGQVDRVWIGGWAAAAAGIATVSLVDENLFVVSNLTLLLLFSAAASAQVSLPWRRPTYLWERAFVLPLLAVAALLPPLLPAPVLANALHAQANQEVVESQWGAAVQTFEAALAADPLNSVVPSYFGDLLVDLYDRRQDNPMGPWVTMRARATELYLVSMRLNPWDAYPRAELGNLQRREGLYAESAAWLRDAVRLDPYTPRYHKWLGEVLLLHGDRDAAAEELREAIRLYPVELLTIEHHEGRGVLYAASALELADAERSLAKATASP